MAEVTRNEDGALELRYDDETVENALRIEEVLDGFMAMDDQDITPDVALLMSGFLTMVGQLQRIEELLILITKKVAEPPQDYNVTVRSDDDTTVTTREG